MRNHSPFKILSIFFLVYILSNPIASSRDLDPNYKFQGIKPPKSPYQNTWSSFQTDLFTGSFGYEYKIPLPPGINKLTPQISIAYNSHLARGPAGWVGLGWEIPLSHIQRDIEYTRKDIADDTFDLHLNGSKKDLVFFPTENRYHTKIESFFKIERKSGAPNEKGEYWTVRTKDGTEYRFGYNPDAENIVATTDTQMADPYVWRWSLDRIKDANGNCIHFSYTEIPANGEVYLTKIEYNNEKKRVVNFTLEDRPDSYLVIEQGSEILRTKRLKEISVYVNESLAKKFVLQHVPNEIGNKSLLASITQYGSDGTSSLPPVKFEYNGLTKGFEAKYNWSTPFCCNKYIRKMEEDGDQYYGTFDMNGDGLADYVKFNDGDNPKYFSVYKNLKSGFDSFEHRWTLKEKTDTVRYIKDLRVEDGKATNTRSSMFDFNRDGIVDLLWADGEKNPADPEYRKLWFFPNGQDDFTGFEIRETPVPAWIRNSVRVEYDGGDPQNSPNIEQSFLDINGDGLPDLVSRAKIDGNDFNAWQIWRNTGTGFQNFGKWPVFHSPGDAWIEDFERDDFDVEAMPMDINGDGLVDIIWSPAENDWRVYINSGSNFLIAAAWTPPGLQDDDLIDYEDHDDPEKANDTRRTLIDINNDGLPDIVDARDDRDHNWDVYLNNGNGFNARINWPAPINTDYVRDVKFDDDDRSMVFRDMLDLNGDGLPDIVHRATDYHWDVYFNKSKHESLLHRITDTIGGKIEISYGSSMSFSNTRLPFNYWVVQSITTDNGVTGPHHVSATTSYGYEAGLYDFPTREFRGFGKVVETRADGSKVFHHYHQTDGLKGKEYRTETVSSTSAPFSKEEKSWSATELDDIHIPQLDQADDYTFDGVADNPKIIRTQFQDYDQYGNVKTEIQLGDISISGDEIWEFREFSYDPDLWIVDKITHRTLKDDEHGDTLRESWFGYDSFGNLIREEEYLDTGTNPVTTHEYYYPHGTRKSTTDAELRTTRYVYDTLYHTFPIETTNAKSHVFEKEFDASTGEPIWGKDPNGFVTSYKYDEFGRKTKEIRPYDSFDDPTTLIEYFIDGAAPEMVKISKREKSGTTETLDTLQFIDGFSNLIQTRSEFENPAEQIAEDIFYDVMGRVHKQSYPYLITSSFSYHEPEGNIPSTSHSYDTLGRPVSILNPDGTEISRVFDHWLVSETDENDNTKSYRFDSKQRLVEVVENNEGDSYYTTYQYKPTGELIQITDALDNITRITHDSIGRAIEKDDPDRGIWTYGYDFVGNLTQQTDARGVTTTFGYDVLNRKTLVDFPTDPDISYYYDQDLSPTDFFGTLVRIVDHSGEFRFKYDQRLRKIQEERIIDGQSWITKWDFDALDRITGQIFPDGERVSFNYNSQGKLESIPGIVSNLDYNAKGQITLKSYPNLRTTTFTYEPLTQRLKSITSPGIQDLSYLYDNIGNILFLENGIKGRTEAFTYDDLNRLKTAGDSEYSFTYTYNAIGNLLQETKDGHASDYTYGERITVDESAGPHAVIQISGTLPTIGTFSINYGSPYTELTEVTLGNVSHGEPTEFIASENEDFSDADWENYSASPIFSLSDGFGTKTVYFKIRNALGESTVKSDTIQYQWVTDSDQDGIPDVWEEKYGLNPNVDDANEDLLDEDGLTNLMEYQFNSNPTLTDTDEDGLTDYEEIMVYGSDPSDPDTDDDGLLDPDDPYKGTAHHFGSSESHTLYGWNLDSGGNFRTSETYRTQDKVGTLFMSRRVGLIQVISALQIMAGIDNSGFPLEMDINDDGNIGLEEAIFFLQKLTLLR